MIELGKLYKYISHGEKVIYSSDPTRMIQPENMDEYHYNMMTYDMIIGEMLRGELFVPLEAKKDVVMNLNVEKGKPIASWLPNNAVSGKVFRILTTTGIVGWAYIRTNDIVEAKENES
jgi:hypothetical protein